MGIFQEVQFPILPDGAVVDVIGQLHHLESAGIQGSFDLLDIAVMAGKAQICKPALLLALFGMLNHAGFGHGFPPVLLDSVEKVDQLYLGLSDEQALVGLFDFQGFQAVPKVLIEGLRGIAVSLGDNDDGFINIGAPLNGGAHHILALHLLAGTVDALIAAGGIDQIDPLVQDIVDQGNALVAGIEHPQIHGPKAHLGHLEPGCPKGTAFH